MVEGLPGFDFAGVKHYSLAYKHGEAPVPCGAEAFLCSENMLRRYIVGIFLVNSAEKYDLTRGFVLFSERICCYCVPMHVICGFWHMKLAAYLTGNNVALWVILRERKAPGRYFRGSVWAF